jgi:hypothetical protein
VSDIKPGVELLAATKFGIDRIVAHLSAAESLLPRSFLEDPDLVSVLAECRESGNHMWMVALQDFGNDLEQAGEDSRLSSDFWENLRAAAELMDFPEFIPFLSGKAAGLPRCDHYDLMAGLVVLQRRLPPSLRDSHAEAYAALTEYIGFLEGLDRSYGELFAKADPGALKRRFADAQYLAEAPPGESMSRLNDLMDRFDELFTLVNDPELPGELLAATWPFIDLNPFVVTFGGGLHPMSRAEVWWRAPHVADATPDEEE